MSEFIKDGWLAYYALSKKGEILSFLLFIILLMGFVVVALVVMHILYQSWEFIKGYFPHCGKRNSS